MKARVLILFFLLSAAWGAIAQDALYQKYSSQKEYIAAYVRNFELDSNNTVDVILLQARDNQSWNQLVIDFDVERLSENDNAEGPLFAIDMRNRKDPSKHAPILNANIDLPNCCQFGASKKEHAIYIFYSNTDQQYKVIMNFLIEKLMH